jgi:PRA1 family protein 1
MMLYRASLIILVISVVSYLGSQPGTVDTDADVGNYLIIISALAIYALLTNQTLLIALVFLIGGFIAINRFGASLPLHGPMLPWSYESSATDPFKIGDREITQKHLYTGLFVIGLPLLFFASPFGTLFWLVGASALVILTHACLNEPGIESEYAQVSEAV